MGEIPSLSIVISNYNYGAFVGDAIDSALALPWDDVEVIVVDDGSTDHSQSVIHSYGSRIQAVFQENQGQRAACNVGFAASRGEAVIFLDADDMLLPDIAGEVAAVWNGTISKVQVLMQLVDKQGRSLQSILPRLRAPPTTDQIRRWATDTGEYPTPPGSGNIYARRFLEKIMPLSAARDNAPDSTCIAMAPFFGDVVTIMRPLVLYRIHGANDSNMLASDANFGREVGRAIKRLEAAQDACRTNRLPPPPLAVLRRGSHLLQLRAASLRLLPARHPLPGDTRRRALRDAMLLPFGGNFESVRRRITMAVYTLLVLAAPLPVARHLIRQRFRAH